MRMSVEDHDLRLVSVWHGAPEDRDLHYSLYNNGTRPLSGFSLCLTGTMWITPGGSVRNATLVRTLSNFLEVEPDAATLEPGGVWTFSVLGHFRRPHHAGDGPLSAYVALREGGVIPVRCAPLARSRRPEPAGRPAPARGQDGPDPARTPQRSVSAIPFPNLASVTVAPLDRGRPLFCAAPDAGETTRAAVRAAVDLSHRVHRERHDLLTDDAGLAQRTLRCAVVADARLGGEGYRLSFEGRDVLLQANDGPGLRHGLVTLCQMAVGALDHPDRFGFPSRGGIADVPRFAWRGVHLDVARTFYPTGELRSFVDLLAWLKINVLHLHLNDDEGWRLDVPGFPEVARVAAWRGHGLPLPPLLGSSHEAYGGTYSAEEVEALVRHAADHGLAVLPELDVPGHAHALLAALPRLREPGDEGGYHSIQGFFGNALNPCLPDTYAFLEAAFATVTSLFPAPWVHIGGDEVAPETWARSPRAVAEAARRGLASTGELAADILGWAHRALTARGRKTVVWDDALRPGLFDPEQTVAVAWQHPEQAHAWAAQGYDVVLAPGNAYYLDMATTSDWDALGGSWAGPVPLEKTYDFEPGLGWPDASLRRLRGVQACIWGEPMHDRAAFDALVFPRLFAFAERAWIERAAKDFRGFRHRAQACRARVDRDAA